MPLSFILSEVSNANEAEGSRTGSRKRTRYRFLVGEALTSYAKVPIGEGDKRATNSSFSRTEFIPSSPTDEALPKGRRESRPGESHPQALAEPYVNVSVHTAPIIQP